MIYLTANFNELFVDLLKSHTKDNSNILYFGYESDHRDQAKLLQKALSQSRPVNVKFLDVRTMSSTSLIITLLKNLNYALYLPGGNTFILASYLDRIWPLFWLLARLGKTVFAKSAGAIFISKGLFTAGFCGDKQQDSNRECSPRLFPLTSMYIIPHHCANEFYFEPGNDKVVFLDDNAVLKVTSSGKNLPSENTTERWVDIDSLQKLNSE